MGLSALACTKEVGKVLLGILFTSLSDVSGLVRIIVGGISYLGRLANLLANNLPLVVLVFLNGVQKRLAL